MSANSYGDDLTLEFHDTSVYRCTSCGDVLMEHEVDGSEGHTRTGYDGDGHPVPVHCGPVRLVQG